MQGAESHPGLTSKMGRTHTTHSGPSYNKPGRLGDAGRLHMGLWAQGPTKTLCDSGVATDPVLLLSLV